MCTRPKSHKIQKSFSGDNKTYDFWKLLLKPSQEYDFSILLFSAWSKMCLWWMSRAHFQFSMKSANLKHAIQTLTRSWFSILAHECYVQNSALARVLKQKRYSRSRFLHWLSRKHTRNDQKTHANHMNVIRFVDLLHACNARCLQYRIYTRVL